MLEWQPAFKLQILTLNPICHLAFELFFNSAQGAVLWPFLKNAQGALISLYFKLFVLQTHTEDYCSRKCNCTSCCGLGALHLFLHFIKLRWKAQAIACLIALLCFTSMFKLNASGPSTTYVRFQNPNPEGGFESSHQFHAQAPCRILNRLLVLLLL